MSSSSRIDSLPKTIASGTVSPLGSGLPGRFGEFGWLPIAMEVSVSIPVLATYIREADFAVRRPWSHGPRRLRDYLLVYVQEGEFVAAVGGTEHRFAPGDFCLIQPRDVLTL